MGSAPDVRPTAQLDEKADLEQIRIPSLHHVTGEPLLHVLGQDILRFAADQLRRAPQGQGRLDGRQIRNSFIVASSLARYEA